MVGTARTALRPSSAMTVLHCTEVKNRASRKPDSQVHTGWLRMPRSHEPTTASARPIRLSIGSRPTPPSRTATRLSAELSLLSPSTNSLSGRHRHLGRVVEPAIVAHLEDRMVDAVRQRLDEAVGPLGAAAIVFGLACAIRLQRRGVVVDEELALPQLDAVARQSHHALDPGLRAVAGPAEHDDVAALGRVAEQAAGFPAA